MAHDDWWATDTVPSGFLSDQFVIASSERDRILHELTRLSIEWGDLEKLPELNLDVVRLPQPDRAARQFLDVAGRTDHNGDWRLPSFSGSALDMFLACVRSHFKATYAGFSPTLGKNRIVLHVATHSRSSSHTSDSYSEASSSTTGRESLRPRNRVDGWGITVGVVGTRLFPHRWFDGGYRASPGALMSGERCTLPAAEGLSTFAAGVILGQAPGAVVDVVASLGPDAVGDSVVTARAIVGLVARGADIIYLPIVASTEDAEPPLVLTAAVRFASNRGVLLVAAALPAGVGGGNPHWPASLPEVTCVGNLDEERTGSTGAEPDRFCDVLDHGTDIASTFFDDRVEVLDAARVGVRGSALPGVARCSGTWVAAASYAGSRACELSRVRHAAVNGVLAVG